MHTKASLRHFILLCIKASRCTPVHLGLATRIPLHASAPEPRNLHPTASASNLMPLPPSHSALRTLNGPALAGHGARAGGVRGAPSAGAAAAGVQATGARQQRRHHCSRAGSQ